MIYGTIKSYDKQFLRYQMQQTNLFSSWVIFFYPLSSQKIENLKTNEKTPGDIIIAHRCTKNHDHMLYCS